MDKLLSVYDSIVFFDTETTGFDPAQARIIEFAAIKITWDGKEEMDAFIRLPEGETIPQKIVELTHITDGILAEQGIEESEMAERLSGLFPSGEKPLLIAHNANFDPCFLKAFSSRNHGCVDLDRCDFIDTLSVYKDRAEEPHKLGSAIEHYGLSDKVRNSHRAIDDVRALYEIVKAMSEESAGPGRFPELHEYVNLFGFNPKYGQDMEPIDRVEYFPQPNSDFQEQITLVSKKRKRI